MADVIRVTGGNGSVTISIPLPEIEQDISSIIQDDSFRTFGHNELARIVDPYVPYLNGPLSTTLEITGEHLRYTQPYARRQYYGDGFNHTLTYHPLATAHWDDVALSNPDNMEILTQSLANEITRRLNNG